MSVMEIREPMVNDAAALVALMKVLDSETQFMMLEPGERQTTVDEQIHAIRSFNSSKTKAMFLADDGDELLGFVVGVGQTARRSQHSMYCVIGIRQSACGFGLGAQLMSRLETWAKQNAFSRMELTVMTHNERAKRLYISQGFEIEGVKRRSLKVDGQYVDELYMAKIWDD